MPLIDRSFDTLFTVNEMTLPDGYAQVILADRLTDQFDLLGSGKSDMRSGAIFWSLYVPARIVGEVDE